MSLPTVAKKFTVRLGRDAFEWLDIEVEAGSDKEAEQWAEEMIEDHTYPDEGWQLSTGDSPPYVTDSWEVGE